MKGQKSKQRGSTSSRRSAPPKNSANTKLAEVLAKLHARKIDRIILSVLAYGFIWLLASYIFYLRFPNNYRQPNFFGEEGNTFGNNIIHHGILHAIGTTFNGYYIWGIYILEKIAFVINAIFYHNEFVNLARSFAVTSYAFLGLIATLPLLLFRRIFKLPALIFATLLILFVPLNGWDYGIIGTLGDAKFAYIFIAFLLLIYRHYAPENSKKIYLVDFVILVCAYTNITVYVMLPFALVRYWPKLKGKRKDWWPNLKKVLLQDRSAQSLIVLGVALLPQLYIIHKYGVPALPGYLDTPYNWKRTIEIFISRSYLYEILFPINKFLNDAIVVVTFLAILGLLWRFTRQYFKIVVFGLLTVFVATFLFVIKRTGVSIFFIGYKDSGPAQFFFPQNWIFGFLFSLLAVEIVSKIKVKSYRLGIYGVAIIGFLVVMAPRAGSYGKNAFEEQTVGNIYANAQKACKSKAQNLSINIYPDKTEHYNDISRQQLCTASALNYQPQDINLGLTPANNNYLQLGSKTTFTQTFVSPAKNLNGLEIYFSTFAHKVSSPYDLKLMDAQCKQSIDTVHIAIGKATDNALFTVLFPTIQNSANKTYCFTVVAAKSPAAPLAIQFSAPNIYTAGQTTKNGKPTDDDVVFALHYR